MLQTVRIRAVGCALCIGWRIGAGLLVFLWRWVEFGLRGRDVVIVRRAGWFCPGLR